MTHARFDAHRLLPGPSLPARCLASFAFHPRAATNPLASPCGPRPHPPSPPHARRRRQPEAPCPHQCGWAARVGRAHSLLKLARARVIPLPLLHCVRCARCPRPARQAGLRVMRLCADAGARPFPLAATASGGRRGQPQPPLSRADAPANPQNDRPRRSHCAFARGSTSPPVLEPNRPLRHQMRRPRHGWRQARFGCRARREAPFGFEGQSKARPFWRRLRERTHAP
jgi:hypothetical protein